MKWVTHSFHPYSIPPTYIAVGEAHYYLVRRTDSGNKFELMIFAGHPSDERSVIDALSPTSASMHPTKKAATSAAEEYENLASQPSGR